MDVEHVTSWHLLDSYACFSHVLKAQLFDGDSALNDLGSCDLDLKPVTFIYKLGL